MNGRPKTKPSFFREAETVFAIFLVILLIGTAAYGIIYEDSYTDKALGLILLYLAYRVMRDDDGG